LNEYFQVPILITMVILRVMDRLEMQVKEPQEQTDIIFFRFQH
jgi:hypothetical protein